MHESHEYHDTPLDRYKRYVRNHWQVPSTDYVDIVMGALFAMRLDAPPVWLYLVGRASSGKGTLLEPLGICRDQVYKIDRLTDKTLISGKPGKGKLDPSLLPKLSHKTLIVTDFSTLLSTRRDVLPAIVAQLRKVYDGVIGQGYSGLNRHYDVKMGFVAACTSAIEDHAAALSELGERCLVCKMPNITGEDEDEGCRKALAEHSQSNTDSILMRLARNVLGETDSAWPTVPGTCVDEFIKFARFISYGRWSSTLDTYTKVPRTTEREAPFRVVRQLQTLACGIAMANKHPIVGNYEMRLIRKVAKDALSSRRKKLLSLLEQAYPKPIATTDVCRCLRTYSQDARNAMQELHRVEVVDAPEKQPTDDANKYAPLLWTLTPKMHRIIRGIL